MIADPLPAGAGRGAGAVRTAPALRRGPIAALVVVALVVRIAVVIATPHFIPVTDAGEFDHIAVSLADHGTYPSSYLAPHAGPTAFRPPLFPGALAAVYTIVGTGSQHTRWDAGRVLEAVFGAIAVWLIALIATRVWGWRVGLVAAGIAAVWPPLVLVGSSLLSESLFIALILASVWAALVYRDDRRLRWAVLAGVFVGLSALTRGNGFLLVIPVGFLVWTTRPRRSWAAVRAPLAVLAAAVVVLIPWTVRNYDQFHTFVPVTTETGYALAGTYNATAQNDKRFPGLWLAPIPQMRQAFIVHPGADESLVSSTLTHEATHYIHEHPLSVVTTVYWNTLRLLNLTGADVERAFAGGEGYPIWLAVLSVYVFWALLALCVAGLRSRSLRAAPLALWGCPLVIYLTTAPLLGLTRYRAPADPFLIFVAALAVVAAWDRIRSARP
ncbi:MAG TPA: glycosyltransferase family 39 protein [Solirubrobacteraceae bacterium]|nr:glycosyltransferase family 39 protein [Solirubrobacteraceae bacterium]